MLSIHDFRLALYFVVARVGCYCSADVDEPGHGVLLFSKLTNVRDLFKRTSRFQPIQDSDGGAGADPARPRLDHRQRVGESPDAAGRLDANLPADSPAHQAHVGGRGAGASIAGGGLNEGRPALDRQEAGADLLLLRKVARLDDHLDGKAGGGANDGKLPILPIIPFLP